MSYIMVRRVDSGCVLKVQLHVVARHKRQEVFVSLLLTCFLVEDDLTHFQSDLESDSCG